VLQCTADDRMRIEDGAASLLLLSGTTAQELSEQFQNQLSHMIVKKDLPQVYADIKEALLHSHSGETEFRIITHSGQPLWVTDRFRLAQNADGTESLYHTLFDNSRDKDALEQLRQVNERNQILIDRSGDIVFDWDLEKDILVCSDRWEARFGYPPVSKNYSGQFGKATHFHPDDVAVMQEMIRRLHLQPDVAKAEVRIASGDGKYLWNEIRATSLPDANGKIVRILGLIKDIDDLKRATLHLKERAERDPLTKLLNKDSTQIFANEYLASRDADSLAALLILDLDNFKHINDRYGHLYGDTILSQIGGILKGLFRSHDIVGRIGGDEFLILLKDIPNEDLLRDRCDTILESIGSMLEKTIPELGGSCSIGAVLIPNHGDSYGELYKKADDALYLAKGAGKNQYCVYDPHEIMTEFLIDSSSRATTSIDSDVQPGIANASFLQYIFKTLYESRDLEQSISDLLQYIGRQLNVSRAYIFENNEDNTLCNNTFEWCNDGIDPQINLLQGISYITDIPDYSKSFNEKGVFYCTDVSQLESHLREILEPQGIKSMLQCAIVDDGVFRGYVGFDECVSKRLWTQDQIDMLAFLAELLAVFLLKKRSSERIAEQAENLRRVLDLQDAWIYVIDPESCELKFLNAKTKKIAPEGDIGMVCHKVFMGRETRCENCPALMPDGQSSGQAEIHNGNYGLKVLAKATKLPWNGKESCLVTCTEAK